MNALSTAPAFAWWVWVLRRPEELRERGTSEMSPQAARRAGRSRRNQEGLSILELVIAMSVFALIMLGLAATIATGLTLTRNNRNRSIAANLASQEMDIVRSSVFTSLTAQTSTQLVGGVPYEVHRELTWVASTASNGPCDGSNGSPEVLRVHVWVDWPARQGVATAKSDTVLTPPVGTYDPNTGHISVKVLDRDAEASANTMVTLTGPTARNAPTNSDGCAFFAYLPAGSYSVALNTLNYVDRQGYQNPTQTVNVTVGQISSTQFDYDQRATLHLDVEGGDGGEIPDTLALTIGNTIFAPSGTRTYTGTGVERTIGDLFPAADGYQVWAGSCADADPEGLDGDGVAYYEGAQRVDPLATTAGATTDGDVGLNAIPLHIATGAGVAVADATVVFVHAADSRCAVGETLVVGTTDVNGDIVAELPLGLWTVQVQGRSAVSSWPSATLSPLDTLPRSSLVVSVQ